MTRGELAEFLSAKAKKFAPTAKECCVRNRHMNNATEDQIRDTPQEVVDAIVVAFVNEVMGSQGIDLGLYSDDVK